MNQFIAANNLNDTEISRRYAGFPLNSTLVTSYTSDTIRSIINHAVTGKPYTTAVWIRISSVGIQISAQDVQIARTRIPVFIPIALVHDIFMQSNINNVICIVYDEVKSNMKGVLLYVVHPTDAHLLREDFRGVKQATYTKGIENQCATDKHLTANNRLFSPSSPFNDVYLNGKLNRQQSPRRIFYVRDNELGINKELTPSSAPPSLPQLSYTPFKGSYNSSRDNSSHRRNKSPRKVKPGHSSSKPGSDNGSKHRRRYRSRSPQNQAEQLLPATSNSQDLAQEQINPQGQQTVSQNEQSEQQVSASPPTQPIAVIPMGIYNRYVPKAIPLPTGETVKTTLPASNTNGVIVAHIEPQQNTDIKDSARSSSPSRSVSPKRQDSQQQNRSLSAHNAEASNVLVQSSHHHHHRRHHVNGIRYPLSRPDTNIYNTISHSFRTHSKYIPRTNTQNNNIDDDNETKQYLKQLIDDMQAMKLEMSKLRLASSSMGTIRGRSDSLRVNLKELRNDIDVIRARIAMAPNISK